MSTRSYRIGMSTALPIYMAEEASLGRTFRALNPMPNPKCVVQIPMGFKITPTRPVQTVLERHKSMFILF
jgi:hypothetical protein